MWRTSVQLYFTLIYLFPTYSPCNYTINSEIAITSALINYLNDLVNLYSDYDINFHFDAKTNYSVDKLIAKLDYDVISAIILINYDSENVKLARVPTKQIIHLIILDDPRDFSRYTKNRMNAQRTDVLHFVLKDQNITEELTKIPGLNLFGNLLFTGTDQENIITYKVCYFCGNSSGKIMKLKKESHSASISSNLNLKSRNFTDFYGHPFKVTFINYFPLVWCDKVSDVVFVNFRKYNVCSIVKGTEYQIITLVSQLLNFKVTPIVHEDDYLGTINQTGIGLFDVAMGGITVTAERCQLATFTTMYWYEGYNCLFFCNKDSAEMLSFLEPLQGILWISVISGCFLIAITFAMVSRCDRYETSNIQDVKMFWVGMQLLIDQQVSHRTISKIKKRSLFLITAWCLVCLNVNTAYKSKLLSTLLNPTHREPQNLMELLEGGYSIVINTNYDDVVSNLFSHGKTKYQQTLRKPIHINNVCDEFDYVATHRAAVVDEYTSLQYEVRNSCSEKLKKNKARTSQVRITTALYSFGHGWALQKRAPYAQAFNVVINRIVMAGLILKWRRDAMSRMDGNSTMFPYSHKHSKDITNNDGRVSLKMLISPFFVYMLGNVFAIAVFIIEVVYHKWIVESKIYTSYEIKQKRMQ